MLYVFCIGKNATSQGQNVWKLVDSINTLSGVNKVTDTPKGDHNKPGKRMAGKIQNSGNGVGGGKEGAGGGWGAQKPWLGCRRLIVSNLWAFAHNDKISELLNKESVRERMWLCQVETIRQHCSSPGSARINHSRCWLTALCTPDRRNDYDNRTLCVGTSRPLRCININSINLRKNFDDLRFSYLPIHRKALKLATWAIYFAWLAVMFCQDACLTAHQSVHFYH